ncbi:leucine-rich repeat-containing protein 74B-like isoform X2 [Mercenaria mercenaria]|uniref:leucine-rich repeat-containing protein 74B-like isoform X2 n=1 Tax=Mercenaria mercenaria TaxID=6596 RepID=UPI00234ED3C7|nr:leucine-rich repeat-containing protein 74B-like isoform X2 [Mercenaria mercenaria]
MPSEVPKVGGSPLPSVTPPRLMSPVKSRLTKESLSKLSDPMTPDEYITQFSDVTDGPKSLEDSSLTEREHVFLTEATIRDLEAIHEEDFEEEDLLVPESSTGDDLEETGHRSTGTGASGVSTMSETEPDVDYDTDLEMEDPDRWLHPDLYDRDTTGINRYLRMCQKLEIQPITYFLKHMQDTELIMKYHGLGPLGVKAMSDPLEINTTIEKMDLEGNYILGIGTNYLSKVLKDNVYVTELILSENKMGNMGAKAICDLLLENKTITYLDLKGNNIEDGAAEDFYDMLSKNTDLKTLILRHNCFEDDGARMLKDSLIENDTLTTLDLSWNHFQWRGCCTIAEGVAENTGLKYLNLCMNGFGLEGAKALEDMLRDNHTLLELDISFCRIPLQGAPHIAAGIQNNEGLQKLNVGYNQIQGEGGYVVLVAADRNEHGSIKYLNFGNLTVKIDFKKLADEMTEQKMMTVLYGNVMLDVTSFRNAKYDPWAHHQADPMTKLKEWLDQAGYRLVDLLLTFDRDGSLSLDLHELKQGIRSVGIDMTDLEVEILMKNLDDDNSGTIDMKELMQGAEKHTLETREAIRYKDEQDKIEAERRKQMKAGDVKDFQKLIQESDVIKPVAIV